MAPLTDNQKIRKQVNFYFSDSNLPYDKYLWTLHANAENHCKRLVSKKKKKLY